jgi:hypothetical protein
MYLLLVGDVKVSQRAGLKAKPDMMEKNTLSTTKIKFTAPLNKTFRRTKHQTKRPNKVKPNNVKPNN